MKKLKCLVLFYLMFLIAGTIVNAKRIETELILGNSYVIGTYLYTSSNNDILDTTNNSAVIYDSNEGLFTPAIMLAATSISDADFDNMIIYYKTYWDTWINGANGENLTIADTIDITHVNGICIEDILCGGNEAQIIKFEANGLNKEYFNEKEIKVNYGGKIDASSLPSVARRVGYELKCWTEKDSDECYDFSKIILNNYVLEPAWEPITYNIIYKDGETNLDNLTHTCNFALPEETSGCKFADSLSNKSGYEFVGWSLSRDGKDSYLSNSNIELVLNDNKNVTLYAVWKAEDFDILYDYDGGLTDKNLPLTYLSTDTSVEIDGLSKIGYKFDGWYYDEEKTQALEFNNSKYIVDLRNKVSVHLYAKWSPITYSFKYNGSVINCIYNKECSINFEKEVDQRHEFVNWYVDTDNGRVYIDKNADNEYKVLNFTSVSKEFELKANVKALDYNITYHYDGGLTDKNLPLTYLSTDTSVEIDGLNKVGYKFDGWYYNEEKTEALLLQNDKYVLDVDNKKNVDIYAKWSPITYSFKYNDSLVNCTYNKECVIDFVANNKDGYEFVNWYIETENGKVYLDINENNEYKVLNFTSVSKEFKLKANMKAIDYTITYNYDGGHVENINVNTYNVENKNIRLNVPTKEGYKFKGWSINGTDEYIFDVQLTSGDVTLTAGWDVEKYNIVYDLNGGNGEIVNSYQCEYNKCEVVSVEPTKNGFKFDGWTTTNGYLYKANDKVKSYSEAIDGTITLTAKWVNSDVKKINYNLNGGYFVDNVNNTFVPGIGVTLSTPKRLGYTFSGWYYTETINEDDLPLTQISPEKNEDVTLYARWEVTQYVINFDASAILGIDGIATIVCNYDEYCSLGDHSQKFTDKGYTLLGWSTQENGPVIYGDNLTFINMNLGNGNVLLYPVVKKNTYDVYYYLDGGSFNGQDIVNKVDYGSKLKVVNPIKENYEFVGWKNLNGEDIVVSEDGEIEIDSNLVLIANWKLKTYSIRYVDEDGNELTIDDDNYLKSFVSGTEFVLIPGENLPEGIAGWKVDGVELEHHYVDGVLTSNYVLNITENKDIVIVGYYNNIEINFSIIDENDLILDIEENAFLSSFESYSVLEKNEVSKSISWDYEEFSIINVLINGEETDIYVDDSNDTRRYIILEYEKYKNISSLDVKFVFGEESGE